MARYLITQSLLSSWYYTFDCMEGYEEDAMDDFLSALRREPRETTADMQNGIDFENEVYAKAGGEPRSEHPLWERGICAVAERLSGAQFQVKVYKEFSAAGYDFLLYGILDALAAGHIYDVKFLNKSFGSADVVNKYIGSPQHPAYLFAVPEAIDFTYLVSDGDELYTEHYTRYMTRPFPDIVSDFVRWLESEGLWSEYAKHWTAL